MSASRFEYGMFGLNLSSGIRFGELAESCDADRGTATLMLDLVSDAAARRSFSGATEIRKWLTVGGTVTVEVVLGRARDILLDLGPGGCFHIVADGSRILCAAPDPDSPEWRRVLLDTVLCMAALLRGYEALHAAAVQIDGDVVAIAALSGGGKSTLCAELIRRGGHLFTDDVLCLRRSGGRIEVHRGPPLMNLPAGSACGPWDRLAIIEDEEWVAVHAMASSPTTLRSLILLSRGDDHAGAAIEPVESRLALLATALDSGPDRGRQVARFELLADLARETPVVRLTAGPYVSPGELADLVAESVGARALV